MMQSKTTRLRTCCLLLLPLLVVVSVGCANPNAESTKLFNRADKRMAEVARLEAAELTAQEDLGRRFDDTSPSKWQKLEGLSIKTNVRLAANHRSRLGHLEAAKSLLARAVSVAATPEMKKYLGMLIAHVNCALAEERTGADFFDALVKQGKDTSHKAMADAWNKLPLSAIPAQVAKLEARGKAADARSAALQRTINRLLDKAHALSVKADRQYQAAVRYAKKHDLPTWKLPVPGSPE